MKKYLLLSAIFCGAIIFSSCGGSSSTTTAESLQTQRVGTLTIGMKFPNSKGLSTQILDPNINCIEVELNSITEEPYTYLLSKKVILTPDNPQATITNIPVGPAVIYIRATDGQPDNSFCDGNTIESLNAYANIAEGENNFIVNLIRAKWEFVDSNGNPSPITLNGTDPTSTETIEGFYLTQYYHYTSMSKQAVDENQPSGSNFYYAIFYGSNLSACDPQNGTQCIAGAHYYIQLLGPSTSNNAFHTFEVSLQPSGNNERGFSIVGVSPCYIIYGYYHNYWGYYGYTQCSYQFSDDTVNDYLNTTVVDSDTMKGYIVEYLVKDEDSTVTCYSDVDLTNEVQCPADYQMLSLRAKALKSIVQKFMSAASLKTMQAENTVEDLTYTYSEVEKVNTAWWGTQQDTNDIDGDGVTGEFLCDNNFDGQYDLNDDTDGDGNIECWESRNGGDGVDFYIKYTYTGTLDLAFYPFTAKASPIPSTGTNLTIQNK